MALSDVSQNFTDQSLDEIIQKAGGVKHSSFRFGEGSKKGDSYLSTVYQLRVDGFKANGEPIVVLLIVKAMPHNLARRKVFRSADFFRNEINFYLNVIPAFEEFQKSRGARRPFDEYPQCMLGYTDGANDFIALENVNFSGYISPNRQNYITLEDCLITMRTLGRYHAVSLAFKDQDPEGFDNVVNSIEEVYYSEKLRNWYSKFLDNAMEVAKDAVSKTYPAGSKYVKLTNGFLTSRLYDDLIKLTSTKSKYSVIGHGDCWSPNFLTRFNEANNTPVAIKIIDFQLARYASFALDFTFFIYSCTSQQLREAHYDDILKEYHSSACDLIRDLGCDPEKVFPYTGMLEELKQFGRFGCGMGIESLPMSMIEDDEVADLDKISENDVLTDVWILYPFEEKEKQTRIAEIFKHAIDCGYITDV